MFRPRRKRDRPRMPGPVADGGALVVWVADLHVNSTVGLCPPEAERDAGGVYRRSPEQDWLAGRWDEAWDGVEAEKDRAGLPLYVVYGGDVPDINQHSKTELVVYENHVAVLDMCEAVCERPVALADRSFVLRGTEAHTGGSGQLEEQFARRIGAEPHPGGRSSWWHLCMEVAGVRGDFAHHAQTYARRPWTTDAGAARQAAITCDEYDDAGEPRPHVVGRAHGHYAAKGYKGKTVCVYAPPWQLSTPFARRLGAARRVEPPGLWLFWFVGQVPVPWHFLDFPPPRDVVWTP